MEIQRVFNIGELPAETVEKFQQRLLKGPLVGEVGHPRFEPGESVQSKMEKVACINHHRVGVVLDIESPFKEPQTLIVKARPHGPSAEEVEKLMQEGVATLGMRAFLDPHGKIRDIVTFDVIRKP